MSTPVITPTRARPTPAAARKASVPRHIYAVVFASLSVVVGVLWDISWHGTIGRDTLFSPPHMAMYLGGVVAGVACGWYVLHTTFAGMPEDRASAVRFWKYFRGPLGAWLCIWGAFAMITSAPFDDWWHNAYGLDVRILSPPHAVLALGILAIQLGALFMVLALQNRTAETGTADPAFAARTRWLFAISCGLVLLNFAIISTEYTHRVYQHSTLFYQIAAGIFVLPLAGSAVAGRLKWPALAAATTYTAVILGMHFILPLFAAEPRLAPIRFPLDRMLPPQFPLLLIVPALVIDLIVQRWRRSSDWLLAAAISLGFVGPFVVVQWPFASLLQSDLARNGILKQNVVPYSVGETSYALTGRFWEPAAGAELLVGLTIAVAIGFLSARVGIGAGRWMSGVRR